MPRPDTGSFNRLLTSLGLISMAAALAIPYFFYRSTSTLQIGRRELSGLTKGARKTIEARQGDISGVQPFVLPGAALLVVLGLGLLAWGAHRLHGAQKRDDREAEARTLMAEAGVRDLTPNEKEQKIKEEVRTETVHGQPANEHQDDGPDPMERTPTARRTRDETREMRVANTRRVEQKVGALLSRSHFANFIFRAQVAVGKLKLDGLFLSTNESSPDVLLEVRVGPSGVPALLVERLLSRVPRYEAERGRRCRPWLVVVFPNDTDGAVESRQNIDVFFRRLRDAIEPVGWATVIQENEIDKLPSIFDGLQRGFRNID